jgi:hypothetical protein
MPRTKSACESDRKRKGARRATVYKDRFSAMALPASKLVSHRGITTNEAGNTEVIFVFSL